MREDQKQRGFTLVEFAVVVMVSGFLLAGALDLYTTHLAYYRYQSTAAKMDNIYSAISNYSAVPTINRLPFPSDPTLSAISNPDAGCECGSCSNTTAACNALVAMPTGACSGGICKVAGHHHTSANPNPGNDPVYIGAVPYKTIMAGIGNPAVGNTVMGDTLDTWNYQTGYAVSSGSTNAGTYGQGVYGVIDVTTEAGVELVSPPGSANFVIVFYGENHMGAHTAEGAISTPCTVGTVDYENCNGDYKFIQGLRSMAAGPNYFDDIVQFSSFSITKLWDFSSSSNANIYNLNVGNVGVGTPSPPDPTFPAQKLDVAGTVALPAGIGITEAEICDGGGTACWLPNLLAGGPVGSTYPSNNWCPPAPPGYINVVTGMVGGVVQCTTGTPTIPGTAIPLVPIIKNQSCNAGHFAIGFSASSGLICNFP